MKQLLALVVLGLAGCMEQPMAAMADLAGQPDLAIACPDDLPDACPTSPPSWTMKVQSIVTQRCESCHAPGGQAATVLLTSYVQVHARASTVLNQVYACLMPPPDGHDLTGDERAALLMWLVCGAPNN